MDLSRELEKHESMDCCSSLPCDDLCIWATWACSIHISLLDVISLASGISSRVTFGVCLMISRLSWHIMMVSVVTPGISVGLLRVSVIILVRGKIRVDTNSQKFPADRFLCGGDWRLGDRLIPTEIHKHNEYIYAKEICKDVKT